MPGIVESNYPWLVFDRIYPNATIAHSATSSDGVPIGRFVLIKYAETDYPSHIKLILDKKANGIILSNEEEEQYNKIASATTDDYINNFKVDIKNDNKYSKDRMIYQKTAVLDEQTQIWSAVYKEISTLANNNTQLTVELVQWDDTYLN